MFKKRGSKEAGSKSQEGSSGFMEDMDDEEEVAAAMQQADEESEDDDDDDSASAASEQQDNFEIKVRPRLSPTSSSPTHHPLHLSGDAGPRQRRSQGGVPRGQALLHQQVAAPPRSLGAVRC
eukprot:2849790-Rhodomonas_salina.1